MVDNYFGKLMEMKRAANKLYEFFLTEQTKHQNESERLLDESKRTMDETYTKAHLYELAMIEKAKAAAYSTAASKVLFGLGVDTNFRRKTEEKVRKMIEEGKVTI